MKYFLTLFISLSFGYAATCQDPLDVLPVSGRNELFHSFLMAEGGRLWDARADSVTAALGSAQSLLQRQGQLKAAYLKLLGDLPDKTPLEAEMQGVIQGDGYYIEKITYQSSPNHHVTANFYIPDTGTGPFPAVLVMCGHYPVAKSIGLYQQLSALLAMNGIAALIVDPFSQGERYQIQNPDNGNLAFLGESGTKQHTRLDVGAMLSGTSVVAHALWDNHRGVDYLYSRTDVVDTSRVGCTGSSGGGAQATYLAAFDERLKVAAINSFLMNEETLFSTIGPQTGSQNLSFEGANLIDHPDYITLFAPKPFLILAGTTDFFDVTATQATYDEAKAVYSLLGQPDNVGYFEENAGHGYLKPRREAAVRWFRKWFYNDNSVVTEPDDIAILAGTDLQVTNTGQVMTAYPDEKSVTVLNNQMAAQYESYRTDFWNQNPVEVALDTVRSLIRWNAYAAVSVEETETINRNGYSIQKMIISSGDDVPVPALLFVPDGASNASPVLYVDGRGKNEDAGEGGVLEQIFVDSGKVVLSIDVRGFGETTDNPAKNESKHGNKEHRNAVISGYIGKTLIGQRVEDIGKAIDVLLARPEVDASKLTLIGIDRAGSAVLHAAALDNRVKNTIIRQSFESWIPMVNNPTELHNLTHVVPFALTYYDLPDLVKTLPAGSVTYFEEPYEVVVSTRKAPLSKEGFLGVNYPNPAASQTVIPFSLTSEGMVSIKLVDMSGQLLNSFDAGFKVAGNHEVVINVAAYPASSCMVQLWVNGRFLASRVMTLVN